MKTPAKRYAHLFSTIEAIRPKTILEIGTWEAKHAVEMLRHARRYSPAVHYIGFDLFESITDQDIVYEQSKIRATYESAYKRLFEAGEGTSFELWRGYTQDTLPDFVNRGTGRTIDLVFIDGGHSLDTIQSDWYNVTQFMRNETVVLFDDYYPDRLDKGCKTLIDGLDKDVYKVTLLQPVDIFPKPGGKLLRTQFARVVLPNNPFYTLI